MKAGNLIDRGQLPLHLGGAVVCALVLVLGWYLGLGPLLSDNQQSASVMEQNRLSQHQALASKVQLKQLHARLQEVREQLAREPVNLEHASAINPLLAELAQWGDENNLTMTRTNAGRPVVLAYYDYVPISLAGEGNYPDLLGFLRQIHQDRGDLGVVAFNANRMGTQGGVAFQLDLSWYVVSGESDATEPATAAVPTD